jgi:putative transposase
VTYRLAGSLPVSIIKSLSENYLRLKILPDNQTDERKESLRHEYFKSFDKELEKNLNEPHWLKDDRIASPVMNSLLFNNNKHYILWCATLMSNHVHILLTTLPGSPLLNVILQNHKKFTAVQGNKVLGRSGKFWAEESYDTLIRNNDHFFKTVHYIINNPVKAGLVEKWHEWKWTCIYPDMKKDFLVLPGTD